ncbi:MAG: tRNA pseudouridine(38-40) synthase TruA [Lachnospiraceae bacterium]|nr:tRNA pseudouridine(38-40) synthase TruA [Lachnospiraceae bacterium]
MKRIRLVVAYDGTNYCGWQLQKNGITIEEVLNRELTALLKEPIAVIGASRTDAGVHAMGNVAVFDTKNPMAADKICLAVNQSLPEDIRVQSSGEVPLSWHPRKANCTKTYEYRIENRRVIMPTRRLYSYFCYFPLNVEKMRQGAAFLLGEHDFKSFCTAKSNVEDTVRTIDCLEVEKEEDTIVIRVSGSGFLYNMVRIIAGTLIRVGTGAYPPEEVAAILAARDRRRAGPTAPAKGLTLVEMRYETELPPWQHSENAEWSYHVLQSHIKEKETAFLLIERCREEDWTGLIRRNVHHAFQNGARKVLIADLEKSRLREGDSYGYYRIQEMDSQQLQQATDILEKGEKEWVLKLSGKAAWYCAVDGGGNYPLL